MGELTAGPAGPRRRKRGTAIVIVGLILLVAGTVALFWNEWRSASSTATLMAGERGLVSVGPDRVPGDIGDRLVHVAGPARPGGVVQDPVFAIAQSALRLDRIVEMYQWREHSEGSGDNRTTRYEQVWAEGRIASERFRERVGRSNPPAPPFASERFQPAEVALGALGVAPELIDLLPAEAAVVLPQGQELFVGGMALRSDGRAFLSGLASRPAIGDVRVRFRVVPPGEISVLAGLDGSVLRPWTAPNGGRIAMVMPGVVSASDMLGAAYRANALRTWGFRAAGTLGAFVGLSLLLHGLRRRHPDLTLLGAKVSAATVMTLAIAWSLLVVAIAWAIFRPLLSLGLVMASAVLFALIRALRARRAEPAGRSAASD
jgi:hypothetical protein